MKKLVSLCLALCLTLSLGLWPAALADEEPVTLTIFVDEPWWMYKDWSGTMPQWMTEQTGITFDVTVCADTNELDMMVASGTCPDVVVTGKFNLMSSDYVCYDWDTLIEQYEPDWQVHPAYKFVNQGVDGKQYTIMVGWSADYEYEQYPGINPEGECATARTDILEAVLAKVGIEKITTVEELEACFAACKELYPDVVPYTFNPQWNNWVYALYGAANSGFVDHEGKAQLWINQPELKNALMTLNRWYREGYLLEENYGWTSASTQQEWSLAGKTFVNAALTNYSDNFDAACMNAGIDYKWTPVTDIRTEDSAIWTTSTGWRGFFISKNCSNPAAAIKAARFMYSKDNGYAMLWGVEGEDWYWNEDHTRAIFNYSSEDTELKTKRQLYWGWLGHDGISNNMAYASNEKTRMGLDWVGSITVRNPVLGLIMNSMDAESREYIIYQQLVELEENYLAKIGTAPTAEEAEALYNEMVQRAADLGAGQVEDWANAKYPEMKAKYEEVRSIGAEGWQSK